MIKTTTDSIEGYEIIQYLSVVSFSDKGTEIYTADIDFAIEQLDHPDADAIIGIKVVCLSSAIEQHCDDDGNYYLEECYPELIAYGTAVKIRKK